MPSDSCVRPVPPGESDQRESGWQQAPVGQVVEGRQQLLAGQVTSDAEEDEYARTGQPGDAPVPRIPQRVSHAVDPPAAISVVMLSSSSFQDAANFSTPSSSSTC